MQRLDVLGGWDVRIVCHLDQGQGVFSVHDEGRVLANHLDGVPELAGCLEVIYLRGNILHIDQGIIVGWQLLLMLIRPRILVPALDLLLGVLPRFLLLLKDRYYCALLPLLAF